VEINRANAETHGIYYQKEIKIPSKGLEKMYADAEKHNEFRIKEEDETYSDWSEMTTEGIRV